jgi:hypothetical protein
MVSYLPPELRERHQRIHDVAIQDAKKAGWSGEHETDDEDDDDRFSLSSFKDSSIYCGKPCSLARTSSELTTSNFPPCSIRILCQG